MRRLILALLVATGLALVAPSFSAAATRSTTFSYPDPSNPPSLGPQMPADELAQYLDGVGVDYNDQTGTIDVTESFWATSFWAPQWADDPYGTDPAFEGIAIGIKCPGSDESAPGGTAPNDHEIDIGFNEATDSNGNPVFSSSATLEGYEGSATGTLAFDGSVWTAEVQSTAFVNQNWRCVELIDNPGSMAAENASGPDIAGSNRVLTSYFVGYAPPPPVKPNSRNMSAAFDASLPTDARIPAKEGPTCPAADVKEILQGALCFAEYELTGRWHLTSGSIGLIHGQLVINSPHTSSWRRRWQVCRQHGWRVGGTNLFVPGVSHDTLTSNNDCGRGQPQSDVYFVEQEMIYGCGRGSRPNKGNCRVGSREVGWLFTDSAGFNSIGTYRCNHGHGAYTCTNALGDSFRYRP